MTLWHFLFAPCNPSICKCNFCTGAACTHCSKMTHMSFSLDLSSYVWYNKYLLAQKHNVHHSFIHLCKGEAYKRGFLCQIISRYISLSILMFKPILEHTSKKIEKKYINWVTHTQLIYTLYTYTLYTVYITLYILHYITHILVL